MINYLTSSELIIAQDRTESYMRQLDTDSEGGMRQIENRQNSTSYISLRQNNNDTPLIVQEILPRISGVIVVASGADDVSTREALTRATATVLGIGIHQVQVFQMQN